VLYNFRRIGVKRIRKCCSNDYERHSRTLTILCSQHQFLSIACNCVTACIYNMVTVINSNHVTITSKYKRFKLCTSCMPIRIVIGKSTIAIQYFRRYYIYKRFAYLNDSFHSKLGPCDSSSLRPTHGALNAALFTDSSELIRFYRAMLCIRGTSHGSVSVCPSVTSRCSTKTAKRRIT